uniref:Uncharacterized protein n=1 Tax=Rhizophora mucronata TaxID=61149 RepID=A0A2P2KM41_RHIMU
MGKPFDNNYAISMPYLISTLTIIMLFSHLISYLYSFLYYSVPLPLKDFYTSFVLNSHKAYFQRNTLSAAKWQSQVHHNINTIQIICFHEFQDHGTPSKYTSI